MKGLVTCKLRCIFRVKIINITSQIIIQESINTEFVEYKAQYTTAQKTCNTDIVSFHLKIAILLFIPFSQAHCSKHYYQFMLAINPQKWLGKRQLDCEEGCESMKPC